MAVAGACKRSMHLAPASPRQCSCLIERAEAIEYWITAAVVILASGIAACRLSSAIEEGPGPHRPELEATAPSCKLLRAVRHRKYERVADTEPRMLDGLVYIDLRGVQQAPDWSTKQPP